MIVFFENFDIWQIIMKRTLRAPRGPLICFTLLQKCWLSETKLFYVSLWKIHFRLRRGVFLIRQMPNCPEHGAITPKPVHKEFPFKEKLYLILLPTPMSKKCNARMGCMFRSIGSCFLLDICPTETERQIRVSSRKWFSFIEVIYAA